MISLLLLAIASVSAPAGMQPAGYASDTVRHMKGHLSLPVAAGTQAGSPAKAACHPDPNKGRACRHHQAQAEESHDKALAALKTAGSGEHTR